MYTHGSPALLRKRWIASRPSVRLCPHLTCPSLPWIPPFLLPAPRSGELPDPSEGEWPALRFLDVDDNRLEGRIGEGWAATGIFRLPSLGAAQGAWACCGPQRRFRPVHAAGPPCLR